MPCTLRSRKWPTLIVSAEIMTMTVNIDNTVFTEYRRAAQLIRDALANDGHEVPLNQLIDLLINAELTRATPEEIVRHFMMLLRLQEGTRPG